MALQVGRHNPPHASPPGLLPAQDGRGKAADGPLGGPDGYVDMMFVSPRHQRRGVARQLLAHVEAHARSEGIPALSADVSITARPFFERHGFTVEAEQHPVKAGVELTNDKMRRELR
ncbi:MAG: GNAT family N-acetyltransferase [Phycicoccus sp.]|nr:GNAT family N-acetyltransferase [Phycicoccus sp.]